MTFLITLLSSILVNNVVLAGYKGLCSYIGISNKWKSSVGMGAALTVVCILAGLICWGIQFILNALNIGYLQTVAFILVVASLVQMLEIIMKKFMPSLYKALGIYLPLITTNCAVLGVAINNVNYGYDILTGVVNGFATSAGFAISIIILAGIREKMEYNDIPKPFRGMPIVLVTAGLMAIAFCGFAGLI